jgi:hypothetical protein
VSRLKVVVQLFFVLFLIQSKHLKYFTPSCKANGFQEAIGPKACITFYDMAKILVVFTVHILPFKKFTLCMY